MYTYIYIYCTSSRSHCFGSAAEGRCYCGRRWHAIHSRVKAHIASPDQASRTKSPTRDLLLLSTLRFFFLYFFFLSFFRLVLSSSLSLRIRAIPTTQFVINMNARPQRSGPRSRDGEVCYAIADAVESCSRMWWGVRTGMDEKV